MITMEHILSVILPVWRYVRDAVYGWLAIIAILVVLLLVFKCYQNTLSIAIEKLRRTEQIMKRLSLAKRTPSAKRIRKLHSSFVRIERLIQAYLYDNHSDVSVSEALRFITAADKAMLALSSARFEGNKPAAMRVVKNAYGFVEKALEVVSKKV